MGTHLIPFDPAIRLQLACPKNGEEISVFHKTFCGGDGSLEPQNTAREAKIIEVDATFCA